MTAKKEASQQIGIRIPTELAEKIRKAAKEDLRTPSDWLRVAAIEKLKRDGEF